MSGGAINVFSYNFRLCRCRSVRSCRTRCSGALKWPHLQTFSSLYWRFPFTADCSRIVWPIMSAIAPALFTRITRQFWSPISGLFPSVEPSKCSGFGDDCFHGGHFPNLVIISRKMDVTWKRYLDKICFLMYNKKIYYPNNAASRYPARNFYSTNARIIVWNSLLVDDI